VAIGDYDNDGWPDLYLTFFGRNVLLRNKGDGTFTDVTDAAGVGAGGWSTSAAFADYDNDGRLDLYVARYVDFDLKAAARPGRKNRFHHGSPVMCTVPSPGSARVAVPQTTATDVHRRDGARGRPDPSGIGARRRVGAYDDDGWLDLFVANARTRTCCTTTTRRDHLVASRRRRRRRGRPRAGGMGADFGDYDNDGARPLHQLLRASPTRST
jgi:hypothetical protein